RRSIAPLLLLTLFGSGCASLVLHVSWPTDSSAVSTIGTQRVEIPAEPLPYYEGTMFDFVCALGPLFGYGSPPGRSAASGWTPLAPFCLVDLPLSAALDTVLLPVDYLSHRRSGRAMRFYRARLTELRESEAATRAMEAQRKVPDMPATIPTVSPSPGK